MSLRKQLQVKVPLADLSGRVLDTFLLEELRPEICVEGPELRYFDRDACRRLANAFRFKHLPVTFHAPFMRLDPGSTDAPSRKYARMYFERTVRLAEYFKPLTMVCHAGPLYEQTAAEQAGWLERSLPVWQWLEKACQDMGTVLTLENILHTHPEQLLPCFQELPHTRWCFDIGHAHVFSERELTHWVQTLGNHLGQLHLHDNFGAGDQHLPVGHGSIAYRQLMQALGGCTAPLSATVETNWGHEFSTSLEYLENIWPWEQD